MADAELNILIKARNQAKGEFDKLNKQVSDLQGKGTSSGFAGLNKKIGDFSTKFQGATGMSLGFASAAGLAGLAVSGLVRFLQQSVAETEDYVTKMTEGAHITGMNVEEYSRFAQVADDVFLSQEKLNTIMQAAARQGIDVSIPGIKKLATQYNSLSTAQEKAKFTAEKFGRTGLEVYKILELDADGIDKAMAAIADGLVVTEQSIDVIYAYKQARDAATDAEDAFAHSVAQGTMPALTGLNLQYAETLEAINRSGAATKTLSFLSEGLEQALLGVKVIFSGYTTEAEAAEKETIALAASQNALIEKTKRLVETMNGLTSRGSIYDEDKLQPGTTRGSIYGKAKGGGVMANKPYFVGESGIEMFIPNQGGSIIPNNQLGGGQTINVTLVYSPAVSLSDRTEAETKLLPFIKSGLAKAGVKIG